MKVTGESYEKIKVALRESYTAKLHRNLRTKVTDESTNESYVGFFVGKLRTKVT